MAELPIAQILSLKDAESLNDGIAIAFTMETTHGEARLALPTSDLGNVLSFFGSFATHVGDSLHATGRPTWPPINDLAPIPATGIGFQAGTTPDTTLLVMNISGFAMAFEIASSSLADMADELSRVARTLSAAATKPQ
jgi:hypothetical protein